jgi:predicted ester cyclase
MNAELARRAIEDVCSRDDVELARRFYASDFRDHVNRLEFEGVEGLRKSLSLYGALFPDRRFEVVDQVADGDRVASRWRMTGTYRGRQVELAGITISRIENGKIAEDWGYTDSLELLRGLGLWRAVLAAPRMLAALRTHSR